MRLEKGKMSCGYGLITKGFIVQRNPIDLECQQ